MLDLSARNLFHFHELPQTAGGVVNKSELIGAVQESTGLDKHKAESAVDAFIGTVMSETRTGNSGTDSGLGRFKPSSRSAREGRSRPTGEKLGIAARRRGPWT